MIVVSDTSPVTALLQLGKAELLVDLFGEVVIPAAVAAELERAHPLLPSFLQVRAARDHSKVQRLMEVLDAGESEAIVLATELHADLLLMDETLGRDEAARAGLKVTGLLGLLVLAKERGLLEHLDGVLQRLESEVGFFISPALRAAVLQKAGEA